VIVAVWTTGVRNPTGAVIASSSPQRLEWLWDSPNILSDGRKGHFVRVGGGIKKTVREADLCLRMRGAIRLCQYMRIHQYVTA
jgi:hypothetical protein